MSKVGSPPASSLAIHKYQPSKQVKLRQTERKSSQQLAIHPQPPSQTNTHLSRYLVSIPRPNIGTSSSSMPCKNANQ
ncbi:hypothetical protein VTJ04DRAFT_6808 [Mycothermus thermophilus]|uniref:uncharacterized protein n=1 Tax=Humicola insolens TaxID=85995 RepID=UPI00374498CB